MEINNVFTLSKAGLLSLCITASIAQAQVQNEEIEEEVYVTGYRGALLNSTAAKRDSVGFSDEVFADDMGKMPSLNLAESLARIPGVKINREVTGEGQQISVRGLGPSFTKVALNGNSIAVASSGSLDAGNRDRQVDLDLFPTELFGSLAVDKTTKAGQLEGGVSGYVNMRTARASDMGEGHNFRFSVNGDYRETADSMSPKVAGTYSFSNDTFGALVTVVSKSTETRVDGFEQDANYQNGCTAEWVDAADDDGNPTRAAQCVEGSTGWNNFNYTNIASADYAAAHAGVSAGDLVDINAVSGLTDDQLDNFGMGRIMRMMSSAGTKDNVSALVSLEYRPNDNMKLALDIISADSNAEAERTEAMLIYRNNLLRNDLAWLPENIQLVDRGAGDRIVSGTFYSARPWIGTRAYEEELSFTSVMPSMSWQINDTLSVDVSMSHTESDFVRDEPYVFYYAPEGTIDFGYTDSSIVPTMGFTQDLSSADIGWTMIAGPQNGNEGENQNPTFRYQHNERQTETNGFHADFSLGEDAARNGFKFGLSSDEITVNSQGFSGGTFGDHISANAPNLVAEFGNYIVDAPYNDLGKNIDGYNGITGIAAVDWAGLKSAVNYDAYVPEEGTGDQFGATVGSISESVFAVYGEYNKELEVNGQPLRTNTGLRYVNTDQNVSTLNGETNEQYSKLLPSFSAVLDVVEDVKLRVSVSRSLTRADPSKMFPSSNWSSNGIENVSTGNPELEPFEATNFDFGGEYYFTEMAYLGWNFYQKNITGFTEASTTQVQFAELTDWGIDINALSDNQAADLASCGGVNSSQCMVNINSNDNIEGTVELTGFEVIWVQPLDVIVEGLGFNASANKISQKSDEGTLIGGISDSYNFTGYYENEDFQARVTYYFQEGADAGNVWGTDLFSRDRAQVDVSASYNLPVMEDYGLMLTFDAYNLTNEPISSYLEDDSQTFRAYFPGATYSFGIRGSF